MIWPRFFPLTSAALRRLLPRRLQNDEFLHQEVVCPPETSFYPPVYFDPADWDRVTAVQYETDIAQEQLRLRGGIRPHHATLRRTVRNALATPWGIYAYDRSRLRLGRIDTARLFRSPIVEQAEGFYPLTPFSTRYFGHWVPDTLTTAALKTPTESLYLPRPAADWPHAARYAELAGAPLTGAELVYFEKLSYAIDIGMNSNRRARFVALHESLRQHRNVDPTPGVFIRRGASGQSRLLMNEDALADSLAARGFAVCGITDPLDTILDACAGARVVISMEGSQWIHGFLGAPRGALMLTINPADRFNNVLADLAPMLDHRVATIVADRTGPGYTVDIPRLIAFYKSVLEDMDRHRLFA